MIIHPQLWEYILISHSCLKASDHLSKEKLNPWFITDWATCLIRSMNGSKCSSPSSVQHKNNPQVNRKAKKYQSYRNKCFKIWKYRMRKHLIPISFILQDRLHFHFKVPPMDCPWQSDLLGNGARVPVTVTPFVLALCVFHVTSTHIFKPCFSFSFSEVKPGSLRLRTWALFCGRCLWASPCFLPFLTLYWDAPFSSP